MEAALKGRQMQLQWKGRKGNTVLALGAKYFWGTTEAWRGAVGELSSWKGTIRHLSAVPQDFAI